MKEVGLTAEPASGYWNKYIQNSFINNLITGMDLTPNSDIQMNSCSFMSYRNDRQLKRRFVTQNLILASLKDLVFSNNKNKWRCLYF